MERPGPQRRPAARAAENPACTGRSGPRPRCLCNADDGRAGPHRRPARCTRWRAQPVVCRQCRSGKGRDPCAHRRRAGAVRHPGHASARAAGAARQCSPARTGRRGRAARRLCTGAQRTDAATRRAGDGAGQAGRPGRREDRGSGADGRRARARGAGRCAGCRLLDAARCPCVADPWRGAVRAACAGQRVPDGACLQRGPAPAAHSCRRVARRGEAREGHDAAGHPAPDE